MPIYNTYTIHLEKKWESAVSVNFVDKDFDNPLENTDEKGLAFAGMDLCFTGKAGVLRIPSSVRNTVTICHFVADARFSAAFRFSWLLPVSPVKRFERNEVEVQAL